MFEGKYILADMCIDIRSLYDEVQRMCRDYRAPEDREPEFLVQITEQDIEAERAQSEQTRIEEGLPDYAFDDPYLETLAVYRKIATACVSRGRLLMHGSVIAVDGRAYMFTARSGTGKSTHVRLWRQLFGDRAVMINDDKPLLRIGEGGVLAFGTPWDGKHRLSRNIAVPLKALCVLERAEQNHIEPLDPAAAWSLLLQQVYRPADPSALAKTLELLDRLCASVRLWRLGCNRDPEAAEIAYTAMKG